MGAQKNDGLKWVTKESDYRKTNNMPLRSVPKPRPIHVNGLNSGSGSDMDLGTDSDEEVYGGQYSVESSPQDDKIRVAVETNYSTSKFKQHQSYSGVHGACFATNSSRTVIVDRVDVVRSVQCDASSMLSSRGPSQSSIRNSAGVEEQRPSDSIAPRMPNFHASGLGPWSAVVAYDACVRLCLNSWAKGGKESSFFLNNECALLRDAFCLRHVLLQSEEELLSKKSSELIGGVAVPKPKKTVGKIKVQVRKVKMGLDAPSGCVFPHLSKLELEAVQYRISNVKSRLSSGWEALQKVQVARNIPKNGSLSSKSLAYVHVGTRYMKEIASVLRNGLTSSQATSSSSYEVVPETYSCLVRLKSSSDEDAVRMQPGSRETHMFFPASPADDLVITVFDSKGTTCGRAVAQVASIIDVANDKIRWWSIYNEAENEPIGKIQLYINCSTGQDDNSHMKCGIVAETVAYDMLLEIAMKAEHFQQRNLLLHGHWKWLVTEFASFYGVSDAYTKLRYLSYVMDVATPTADCLCLIRDLLSPVLLKGNALSNQEKRILGESLEKVEEILSLVFENYKSLDETSLSGLDDVFKAATGVVAPAMAPAIKLYGLQHDMMSSEARLRLCKYFQVAAKKRSRRHLGETDEFVLGNDGTKVDNATYTTAYQKMKSLCLILKNEIYTDIEINNHNVLPSFLDLPNLTSSVYSVELSTRLRTFLKACPPTGPLPYVTELVMTVADFERDLALWNITFTKGGVNAKELFGAYISNWIKERDLALLESCKAGMAKYSDVRAQGLTSPFLDEIYDQLRQTLNDYEIIVRRWPEYAIALENVMADAENAMVEALDRYYADVLSPLKDSLANLGLKYVQKIAKRTDNFYSVPAELGVVLNSMRRMLDVLFPKIEAQLKSWGACINDTGNAIPGERLNEVTIMLRAKLRNYIQAVVEKLLGNTRLHHSTRWKKIIQDFKETSVESDVQGRMQPLQDMVTKTIDHLYSILETCVFVSVCRGFWDRMGQEVLNSLENSKENRSWFKGVRIALRVLDETFASQMQRLMGNSLQEKDLEPPRSIQEAHSMLCKDSASSKEGIYYY
uniref:Uncharacterized protein n=1 Tax=Opuntia streptacantha TaxID=393608 RepID=A0A7C9EE15_OPUST